MPELPDLTVYVEHLARRVTGERLERVRVAGWNLLRTAEPPLASVEGRVVRDVARAGKRIVLADDAALAALDAGGLEPLAADLAAFSAALAREDHTLKRALTDPRLFAGIGNSYSDEILHRARLSPFARTTRLTPEQVERLQAATNAVLRQWTERLREETGEKFPERVTAFREGMAVHGRYRKPCPDCGAPVQRVRYAENEMNYCARCQTGGRLLADRALSRLLKDDWPKTLEELEERAAAATERPPASAPRSPRGGRARR